jgi:hypothetical protein
VARDPPVNAYGKICPTVFASLVHGWQAAPASH